MESKIKEKGKAGLPSKKEGQKSGQGRENLPSTKVKNKQNLALTIGSILLLMMTMTACHKNAPVANFTTSVLGKTVSCENLSIDATSFFWDFGDGSTSNQKNPSHTYYDAGTYCITLTANNKHGADTKNQNVYISGSGGGTSGTLKLTNITSHPFKIYIDGAYKNTVSGGNSYSYTDAAGSYSLKVEQTSGYYEYPLTLTGPVSIYSNTTTPYDFPGVTTGYIKIVSQTNNPYTLYINGSNYGTISGNSSKTVEVDAWHSYNVRVLQQSGYVLYPSEYTWTVNVDANYIYTRSYPTKSGDTDTEIIK